MDRLRIRISPPVRDAPWHQYPTRLDALKFAFEERRSGVVRRPETRPPDATEVDDRPSRRPIELPSEVVEAIVADDVSRLSVLAGEKGTDLRVDFVLCVPRELRHVPEARHAIDLAALAGSLGVIHFLVAFADARVTRATMVCAAASGCGAVVREVDERLPDCERDFDQLAGVVISFHELDTLQWLVRDVDMGALIRTAGIAADFRCADALIYLAGFGVDLRLVPEVCAWVSVPLRDFVPPLLRGVWATAMMASPHVWEWLYGRPPEGVLPEWLEQVVELGTRSDVGQRQFYALLELVGVRHTLECFAALAGVARKVMRPRGRGAVDAAGARSAKFDCIGAALAAALVSGDVRIADADGETLLHKAARSGRAEDIVALLDAGAHPEARDRHGWTALHRAALSEGETLWALVSGGAPVDVTDNAGITPLHRAAIAGKEICAIVLVANGADVNAVDRNGATPLHLAASAGMTELLVEMGADTRVPDRAGPGQGSSPRGGRALLPR